MRIPSSRSRHGRLHVLNVLECHIQLVVAECLAVWVLCSINITSVAESEDLTAMDGFPGYSMKESLRGYLFNAPST
jgi:hypothetical protein